MKHALAIVALLLLAAVPASAQDGTHEFFVHLKGWEEVPAVSTNGTGRFAGTHDDDAIDFELRYVRLSSAVTQAHIHFGQESVNGGIAAFLCSNLGNAPAGTPTCPVPGAVLEGSITAATVVGPAGQGIGPGEFEEVLRWLEEGLIYVNVHTVAYPGGEIRSQIPALDDDDDDDDDEREAEVRHVHVH